MNWNLIQLRNAPGPVRCLAGGYLFALSFAYAYAVLNIALVVGLTPREIAIHYYGSDKKVEAEKNKDAGEQELSFDDLEEGSSGAPAMQTAPSLKSLVAEGHFHLFGMSSFFFGLTLLGLFVGIGDKWKSILVFSPYVAVVIDNLSFLATRFLGPHMAWLTAAAGSLIFVTFSGLWILVARELIIGWRQAK
ncbi:MAG: hypothetical protein KDD25_06895 [Bdellovibrionales bacterium]|nr:hypothetical protein [Bdellovibrionales bacterium]